MRQNEISLMTFVAINLSKENPNYPGVSLYVVTLYIVFRKGPTRLHHHDHCVVTEARM
jgi:hypothetical protein